MSVASKVPSRIGTDSVRHVTPSFPATIPTAAAAASATTNNHAWTRTSILCQSRLLPEPQCTHDVDHAVVPFMTRVLEHPIAIILHQRHSHCPRPRKCLGILESGSIVDRVRIDAREAFDDVHVPGASPVRSGALQ